MGLHKNEITLTASTYSLTEYDEVINVDLETIADDVVLTLPDIGTFAGNSIGFGRRILVNDESQTITAGTYTITVNASGSDLIDVSSTYVFSGQNSFSFFVEYVDEGMWTVLSGIDGTSGTSGVDGLTCYEYDITPGNSATTISYNSCSCDSGDTISTLLPIIDCGSSSSYNGGYGYPVEQPVNFGTETGVVSIDFNAYTIPDRFIVYYNNSVVIDTGYRGGDIYNYGGGGRTTFINWLNGLTDPVTGNVYPFSDPSHAADGYPTVTSPGTVTDTFNKNIPSVTYGVIKVYGPSTSTLWNMDIGCPNGDGAPVGESDYSVSICATETPTIIEGDTGITINCVGLCMGSSDSSSSSTNNDTCTKWIYNTGTTASGLSTGQVRFNNSDITGSTEIYIHVNSGSGDGTWYEYFQKLVNTLCCTLKVRVPNDEHSYIVFDYDSDGSTLESNYLKFVVNDLWGSPLIDGDGLSSITDSTQLCLEFDLFRCENTNSASGTGDTINQPCYGYWQYSETSLSGVTSIGEQEINNVNLSDNGGNGQFTIGVSGGTDIPYNLSSGDTVYVYMTQTNYWGNLANAMNIGANSQIVLTQWNNNSTNTTGEIMILETSDILYNDSYNYIVFEATITEISNELLNGVSDNSFYCVDVSEISQPTQPPVSTNCSGKFRMGVFTPTGDILISSSGQDVFQFDGTQVSNGDAISSMGGGGIVGSLGADSGFSLCSPYNDRKFYFSRYDYGGVDTSSFFNSLIVGDQIKYELEYDDTNNDSGDYLIFELTQPVQTETDSLSEDFYILYSLVLIDQSNINSCLSVFSKPNNLVCLTNVTQIAQLPPPPGGDELQYTVERLGTSFRPSVTGSTVINNSDITNLSGTTLYVSDTDTLGIDNTNRLSSTISDVTLNYRGCEITYEVTSQGFVGVPIPQRNIVLGNIITNGFDSPRGLKYSASTVTTGTTMYMKFNTSTDGIVLNPGEDRVTTSDGSTNKVVAQPNLKFSGDVLYISSVTQYDTTAFAGDVLEGQIRWNSEWSTFDMGMTENVTQQVGQEQYYYAKNQTGLPIYNGTVVMATGTTGNSGRILISPAIGDGTIPARYVMGIVTENISNGEDGFVTSFGLVRGINTEGPFGETWNDDDELWVSPTNPGALTNIEPTEPNLKVSVALVIHAHSNGSVFVRPTFFGRLNDLQNLQTSGETDGDLVVYDSGLDVWKYTKFLKGDYTISGNTTQYGNEYQKSNELDTTGTGAFNVSAIPVASGESAFFNYIVKERTNSCMRTGTVMSVTDGTSVQFTDTSTPDINCLTKGIEFDVRINGTDMVLRAVITSGDWNIRVRNEVIF